MAGSKDQTPKSPEAEQIAENSKESMEKLHSLVDELKTVEEHEKTVLGEPARSAGGGS
jgi:hypothetical protein